MLLGNITQAVPASLPRSGSIPLEAFAGCPVSPLCGCSVEPLALHAHLISPAGSCLVGTNPDLLTVPRGV